MTTATNSASRRRPFRDISRRMLLGDQKPASLSADGDRPLHRGLIGAMILAALVLVFFRLADYRTFGKHEGFAVVTAREMMTSGDWIIPRFGGLPRLEKPPLGYWVVATSARLCGGLNEFSARLPAACSALVLAMLVGFWARRWYGPVAGAGSAAVLISSILMMTYARRAEVDMLLLLLSTGAMFLIADQPVDERGFRAFARWTGIYLLLSLAWMAKFHYGPVMVLAPALSFLVFQRRWRNLFHAMNPLGLAMMTAAITVWASVVAARVPDAQHVWHAETVGRIAGELGTQPVWYCFLDLGIVLLPWSPIALLAAPASWKAAWSAPIAAAIEGVRGPNRGSWNAVWSRLTALGDSRERYLWTWLAAQFSILLVAADKHQHYLAALVPMLALLAGQGVRRVVRAVQSGDFELGRPLAIAGTLTIIALGSLGAFVIAHRWPELSTDARLLGLLVGVGGTAAIWLLHAREYIPAAYLVMGSYLGCYMVASTSVIPADDYRRPAAEFARHIRQETGTQATLYPFALGLDPLDYYLGEPIHRIETTKALKATLADTRSLRVVAPREALPILERLGDVTLVDQLLAPDPKSRVPELVCVDLSEREPTPVSLPSEVRNATRPNEPATSTIERK